MDKNDAQLAQVFHSFQEENAAEYKRRKSLTAEQRSQEFSQLQKRMWGEDWSFEPMKKIPSMVTTEKLYGP